MKMRRLVMPVVVVCAALLWCRPARALTQFSQQGAKLVGTGAVNFSGSGVYQGWSTALSADGNTAIVGGYGDDIANGAVWIYTRSAGVWTQQGQKLVDPAAAFSEQGWSAALSADGNTAIVGADTDDFGVGAAYVWTRSGHTWTRQGAKLVGSGAAGLGLQGYSVGVSADGNTAIVGGVFDDNQVGAVWIWKRTNGLWTQQGPKLVGSGALGKAEQGWSVAISADGNTALVGGYTDNNSQGAVWVWTRSVAGVWSQQGAKLVATGADGIASQGSSVSLSADGNTAFIGGENDHGGVGAAWVWKRASGVWSQQGSKLVGTGFIGTAQQGWSVALSDDGNTAVVGAPGDNNGVGATWVWKRSGSVWSQQGNKLIGSGASGQASQGWAVALSGDGHTALIGGYADHGNDGAAWVFLGAASGSGGCVAGLRTCIIAAPTPDPVSEDGRAP